MKRDADEKYAPLFTESTPIDKLLFGGDVSKTLTDIGICNRISRKIKRGGGFGFGRGYPRGRGGRGTGRYPRGRGARYGSGSFRGRSDKTDDSKNSNRWSSNNYR